MSSIVNALALGVNSGIFWLGMTVVEFFLLVVIGFVPLALLLMWLINPAIINGIFLQFGLNEKSFDKKSKKGNDNTKSEPTHDEIRYAMLTVFYKKAETNSHDASVGIDELTKLLNVDEHIIEFNLMYLEEEKLLKHTVFINDCPVGAMTISSAGINVIEHKEENKNRFPFLTANIPIQIQAKIGLINVSL